MKIQNGSGGVISLDLKKMKGTEKADTSNEVKTSKSSRADRAAVVDAKVSVTLEHTLDLISDAGLTAGEVHSNVDSARVTGLLKSMDVEAKRPKLDMEALMKLADKVSEDIQNNPEKAREAFNEIDPSRVADLL
jgi:hypothetical protein